MSKHCCIKMEGMLEEYKTPIEYIPYKREYYLHYLMHRKPRKNDVFVVEALSYCPWCGSKLPEGLLDEWIEIVQEKFGVTDTLDREQLKKIPQEFMTDEWWKKRGL